MEHLIRELLILVKIPTLSRVQTQRVHYLWRKIREHGFTNKELAELCDDRWSIHTIKRATRGIQVKEAETKNMYMEILAKIIEENIQLDEIQDYLTAADTIGNNNFKDLSLLSSEINRNGLTARIAIDGLAELRQNYMTLPEVLEIHRGIVSLAEQGLNRNAINHLCTLSQEYGGVENVLEIYYLSLQLHELRQTIQSENNVLLAMEARIQKLDQEWRSKTHVIHLLTWLILNGYSDENIINLFKAAKSMGTPNTLFKSIALHQSYKQMQEEALHLSNFKNETCEYLNRLFNEGFNKVAHQERYKQSLQNEINQLQLQIITLNASKNKPVSDNNQDQENTQTSQDIEKPIQ